MQIEEALRAHLAALPLLAPLVAGRIYPGQRRPQGTALPQVTFENTSRDVPYTLLGPAGLPTARLVLDCWGGSYAEAAQVARAVRAASTDGGLDGYRGGMGELFVQAVMVTDAARDEYVPPPDGSDVGDWWVGLDVQVTFEGA